MCNQTFINTQDQMLYSLVPKSKENTYSKAPSQTNLTTMLATKLPTNGEKHKTNGRSNSSVQHVIGVIKWAPSFTDVL